MSDKMMAIEEIKAALVIEAKSRKMNRWDAMNFVAGYSQGNLSINEAMEIVNLAFMMELIKK